MSRPKKRVEEQRNKDQIRNSGRSFSGEAYKAENVKKETKKATRKLRYDKQNQSIKIYCYTIFFYSFYKENFNKVLLDLNEGISLNL